MYILGVDLGTTVTGAAIARNGTVEVASLGTRGATISSIVVVREDGDILVGDAAERRAVTDSSRAAREFKRRLGDPTPLLLGGVPYGAEALTAHLLRAVIEQVAAQEGSRPDLVVVTHPANYGPYKLDLVREAVRLADARPAELVPEPVAAAVHYASRERIAPGEVVAVYDFGGGTFDAAVLRRTEDGFELLGEPEGMERLGGIDFDEAVLGFVVDCLGEEVEGLDESDPAIRTALARLRDDCRAAKEALSADTDAVIPVLLPTVRTEVRLTRAELESMIGPRVDETITALERAVRSSGLGFPDLARILLVGGSSRIPLVAQRLREATGRPIALDAHPKHSIALGAAAVGQARMGGEPGAGTVTTGTFPAAARPTAPPVAESTSAATTLPPAVTVAPPPPSPAPAPPVVSGGAPSRNRPPTAVIAGVAAAVVVGLGVAAVALTGGSGGGGDASKATPSTSAAAAADGPTSTAPRVVVTAPDPDLLFRDSFAEAIGWAETDQPTASVGVVDGSYRILVKQAGFLQRAEIDFRSDLRDVADLRVESTVVFGGPTTSAGLVCHGQGGPEGFYLAVVDPTGGWAIYRDNRPLADGRATPLAAGGRRLRFECAAAPGGGVSLAFSVDGARLGQATDPSPLPAGQVGVAVLSQARPGAEARFDDIEVRKL